jgi:hypothetical protein
MVLNECFQMIGLIFQRLVINMQEIESKILNDVKILFNSYCPEFLDKKVTFTDPEIRILNQNEKDYSSELSIQFNKEGEFCDMFEFFLFRNGKSIVSENEVIEWLKVNIKELLSRA